MLDRGFAARTRPMDAPEPDRAVTVITNDGAFRVVCARTTLTARGVVDAQSPAPPTLPILSDLVSATILVRLTMAPSYRVQGILRGADAHGTMVADAYPDGGTRGLLRAKGGRVELGQTALMQVMRSLPSGQVHQGVVGVDSALGVSGALMGYLLESEQVTSVAGVGTVIDDGAVRIAGGWLVQLLPECTEPPLAVMYERLRTDFSDTAAVLAKLGGDPMRLVEEICWGMEYTQTQDHTLHYRCRCSAERVLASLATVGRDELLDMVQKGEPLFITCDYCRQPYEIAAEALRGLLDAS